MELAFPSPDSPVPTRWAIPLGLVSDAIGDNPTYAFFMPRDFTARALVLRRGKGDVVQYLHAPTGRYLYVDFGGRLFRFVPPREERRGTGRLVEVSLATALRELRQATGDPPNRGRFDPPPGLRPDGRPALRLIHGGHSRG